MTTPSRPKRRPAMGAGRPGNEAAGGKWDGNSSVSNALEPAPIKYSPQMITPIASDNMPPMPRAALFWLDESIHKQHPITRYAKEDHGVIRVGLAMWPAAKNPRKTIAVKTTIPAVALPKRWIFNAGSG